jgi:hypothetical protein
MGTAHDTGGTGPRSSQREILLHVSALFGPRSSLLLGRIPVRAGFAQLRLRSKGAGMATASAGRATRVRRRLPRALAARRLRGLGAGQGQRQAHGQTAQLLRPNARSGYDPTRPRNRGIAR